MMINNAVNFNENSMEMKIQLEKERENCLMKFTRTYRRLPQMRLMTFYFFGASGI